MEIICFYPRRRQKRRLACVKTRQSRQRWYVNFHPGDLFSPIPPFSGADRKPRSLGGGANCFPNICVSCCRAERCETSQRSNEITTSLSLERAVDMIRWRISLVDLSLNRNRKARESRFCRFSPHRSDYWHKVRLCWRNMAQGKRTFIYCSRINNSRANFHDTPVDSLAGFGWSSRCLNDRKIVHNYFRSGI